MAPYIEAAPTLSRNTKQECADTWPVLKVALLRGAVYQGNPMNRFMSAPSLPNPTTVTVSTGMEGVTFCFLESIGET